MWIQSSLPRYIRMVMSQRSVTWSQQVYMRRNCLLPYQLNLCRCFSNVDNDKFENAIAGLSSNDKDPITVGNKQGRKKYNYSKEEKAVQKPEQDDRFITSIKKTRQMFKEAEVSFKSDESQKKSASADRKAKDRLNQSNDTPIKNKKAAPVKHKSTGKNEPRKHSNLPDDWTETFGTLASPEDKLELSAVAKEKSEFQESLASVTEEEEEKIFRHRPLVKHGRHPARWYGKRIQALGKEHKVAEAVEVFETWMLQQDRVQPTAYEFNSVVNILAQAGDVKKAFKLYRLMKSMKIYPKPMLYTCLFNACANTDYPQRGLKLAQKLRNEIFKTEYQPNFQNYQAMIKAFGMCGDINTAFNVADEAAERRVNGNLLASLLVACISDKEAGYRHALMVWRKFVQKGIRPEAKHYNLLIRAINECGIGHVQLMSNLLPPASTASIDEAYTTTDATLDSHLLDDGDQMESDSQHYEVLTEHMATDSDTQVYNTKQQQLRDFDYPEDGDNKPYVTISDNKPYVINYTEEAGVPDTQVYNTKQQQLRDFDYPEDGLTSSLSSDNKPYVINYTEEAGVPELLAEKDSMFENSSNGGTISDEIGNSSEGAVTDDWVISSPDTTIPDTKEWWQLDVFTKSDDKLAEQEQSLQPITSTTLPCVLYPDVHLPMTTDVSRIKTAKDRLAILGGLHALLDAMKHDHATGDIVTFTQLVNSVPPWQENELIIAMKVAGVVPDVDFYNHLIRKRSSQTYDHTGAMEVWDMILDEGLTPNLHTYGGLARACRNKRDAERLLNEMAAANMMPNELIISEMIRGSQLDSGYLKFLLRTMHEFDIKPKRTTILYLEKIIKKAKIRLIKIEKTGHSRYLKNFEQNVNSFISFYERWSKYNYLGDDQKKEKKQQHR